MDRIKDPASPYPQMLPSAAQFAAYMTELGIRRDDILVVYDTLAVGLYSSPRVAWTCRHFGHEHVHVLNTFRQYVAAGFPLQTAFSLQDPSPIEYLVQSVQSDQVITCEELETIIQQNQNVQILDSRPETRFIQGHMPRARNIPLPSLLDPDQSFLSPTQLRQLFERSGVDKTLPLVVTCNSGVTAAALALALRLAGYPNPIRLYDGSWSEWMHRGTIEIHSI
ncbi:hypothetical protein ASPZODRAFT_137344 [Penicilliopsis zonata CBS 506.65]|uniref:Rhodanese domain-containing protein n=1 Tax=Penicilliopsis zonata CBS 506.65 TaxID=1073090 RepID=A0A1L9S575_9EURO|nr:hypothetical protein ASPZODRAFT_137344 [Penicilliopsis zonata CBS 506.65]OJJ42323.1 hypothetical protein ASPZODRAFT_137344 [Penicilliopsis zonata CBS 506.65]